MAPFEIGFKQDEEPYWQFQKRDTVVGGEAQESLVAISF